MRTLAILALVFGFSAQVWAGEAPATEDFAPGAKRTWCTTTSGDCETMVIGGIKAARQVLTIAVEGIDVPEAIDALRAAVARGVDVRILVDRNGRDADRGPLAEIGRLKAGVLRVGDEVGMRGGLMIVDGIHVVLGGWTLRTTEKGASYQNTIVVSGDAGLTRLVAADFLARWGQSRPF